MAAFFMEILRSHILTVKQNFGRLDLYPSDSGRKGRCAMKNRNELPETIAGGLVAEIIFLNLSFFKLHGFPVDWKVNTCRTDCSIKKRYLLWCGHTDCFSDIFLHYLVF